MTSLKKIQEVVDGKRKITKGEFDRLMVRGWKEHKKRYVKNFFRMNGGMCAIGVVIDELGLSHKPSWIAAAQILPDDMWNKIADTSNDAGNKTAAIKAVKALQW